MQQCGHQVPAGGVRTLARRLPPISRRLVSGSASGSIRSHRNDYDLLGSIPTEPQQGRAIGKRGWIQSIIVDPTASKAVSSDEHGRLRVRSIAAAKERMDTVLHFTGASRNLTIADFKRILPEGKHIPGWRSDGGLLAAIPMRNRKTLEKLDEWLLSFSTPYHAALYHSRLLWFHECARINTPLRPIEIIRNKSVASQDLPFLPPAPGMVDLISGEDLQRRVQEYTVYSPRQSVMVRQYVPPFKTRISENLWWHHQWTKPDSKGQVAYPVMVSLEPAYGWFHGAMMWKFIRKDAVQRGLPWNVYDSADGVQRMFYATYETGEGEDRISHDLETGWGLLHPENARDVPMDRNKWMIRFKNENEAKRFIRRWDRQAWDPTTEDDHEKPPGYVSPILKLDQLW